MSVLRRILFGGLCSVGLFVQPIAPAFGDSVAYSYDALGRLVRAEYSNGVTIDYSYDAAGNRTEVKVVNDGRSGLEWLLLLLS